MTSDTLTLFDTPPAPTHNAAIINGASIIKRRRRVATRIRQMAEDMAAPTDTHVLVYLAGIVDGEGCISIYGDGRKTKQGNPPYRLSLAIAMQHRPTLELFVETFGGKIYLVHTNLKVHKTPYWRLPYMCNKAARVLNFLRPYLRIKAEQAELGIAFQSSRIRRKGPNYIHPQSYWDESTRMKERMSELNHHDSVSLRRLVQGSSEFTATQPVV